VNRKKWGAMELRSVGMGWETWMTPKYTPLPGMCYHVKFGSFATTIRINRKTKTKNGKH